MVVTIEGAPSKMSSIEKSIDVNATARTAYNQWTQFEQFPNFMDGVISVQQMDNKRLHWRTNIGGIEKSFDTEITEQIPDKRIAWRSLSGAPNPGVVTFHSLNPETTRIMLQMECELDGVVETAGDMLGVAPTVSRPTWNVSMNLLNPEERRLVRGGGKWNATIKPFARANKSLI
jgi:uncharacterized membrane protein